MSSRRVLVVDLNNFARYPTVPVGYLVAACRAAGMQTSVFSPLSLGVTGVVREAPVPPWGLSLAKLNYLAATSRNRLVRGLRQRLAARRRPALARQDQLVLRGFLDALAVHRPEVVLVSTYLMYRPLVARLTEACGQRGIAVIVGGPYFAQPEVVAAWIDLPGLTALAGGELEPVLPEVIETAARRGDLSGFAGVYTKAGAGLCGTRCPPLRDLDHVPLPDYADFPWAKYPNRIVPVITGRGCGWGACTFCSDVTSSAGRTFRSRAPGHVLAELAHQHQRTGAQLFVFTDLKLNSDLVVWRRLLADFQTVVPGARWIGLVHVAADGDHGLSPDELRQAAAAGCVRLSTGLESGSQRLLDRMRKGTDVARTGRFLRDAAAAGISTRCTLILGYPGEQAEDVAATVDFLRQHEPAIERVLLNRFQLATGAWLHRAATSDPTVLAGGRLLGADHAMALVHHEHEPADRRAHRAATLQLFEVAHRINRRPLRLGSRDFDGVM